MDAGFSGDWQALGVLSDGAGETARVACYTAAAAHVVLTGAAAFIANTKGVGLAPAAITLAVRNTPAFAVLSFYANYEVWYYCAVLENI